MINPIIKFVNGNLTKLDILGISVFIGVIIGIILFFKISDNKFRELENEDFEEYKKNTDNVENEICKISVTIMLIIIIIEEKFIAILLFIT